MDINIRQATEADIPALYDLYETIGQKDEGYFEACFEKDCLLLIASMSCGVIPSEVEGSFSSGSEIPPLPSVGRNDNNCQNVGFGVLNFEPKYSLYQKLEIPEIQDLNVTPDARQQGVATALVESFEVIAQDQGAEYVGISVGLTKDYGPAQRLYFKLGYMPDGNGITYDRDAVTRGTRYAVDDVLCLMMLKEL
jgi:ribosomal protein S18 acetylase RimI-like enzyme